MDKMKARVLSTVALIVLIGFALACGGGGGSGGDGISDGSPSEGIEDTPGPLEDLNLVEFHKSFTSTDNNWCVSCHGDMTHAETLSATVNEFHLQKTKVMSTYDCVDCHKSVDLLQGSGGNLRKQVDVETICYPCHGPGAITQLYQ